VKVTGSDEEMMNELLEGLKRMRWSQRMKQRGIDDGRLLEEMKRIWIKEAHIQQ
jgi:hypothetical protein